MGGYANADPYAFDLSDVGFVRVRFDVLGWAEVLLGVDKLFKEARVDRGACPFGICQDFLDTELSVVL